MHEFDFDNLMLQQEANNTVNVDSNNTNNNNNVNTDHSDDSSSANEKEYPEEEEEEEEIEETYFLKQNQQLTAHSILDKINIMQDERSINGTDSITLVTNDNHIENINNNNNNSSSHIIESNLLNSSKTTSSVSSSTSISSNAELGGDRCEAAEETTSVTSNNENESQPIPAQDSSSFSSTSMTHIQNDLFELDANSNETRFELLDCFKLIFKCMKLTIAF